MTYRLTARDLIFCEGTLAECQDSLRQVSEMIRAGFSTDFTVEEFLIIDKGDCDVQ